MHLGPPVLDKVERSWSCWRHPNASGVGVNVACAMGNTRFSQAQVGLFGGGVWQSEAARWAASRGGAPLCPLRCHHFRTIPGSHALRAVLNTREQALRT